MLHTKPYVKLNGEIHYNKPMDHTWCCDECVGDSDDDREDAAAGEWCRAQLKHMARSDAPEHMRLACFCMLDQLTSKLESMQEKLRQEAERTEATGRTSVFSHHLRYVAARWEWEQGQCLKQKGGIVSRMKPSDPKLVLKNHMYIKGTSKCRKKGSF